MIKKLLISFITASAIINFWSFLTCRFLFKWIYFVKPDYYNQDMLYGTINWYFWATLNNLLLVMAMTFIYSLIYKYIPGKPFKKGFVFGLSAGFFGFIIPLIRFYLIFDMSSIFFLYAFIDGLIFYVLIGTSISLVYGK